MDYSQFPRLEFRRKFLKIFGAEITISDPATEQTVGFIKMKAWKLREDIRIYTDKSMQTEVFRIAARQIIDFGATYDIFDSASDQLLFSMQRKGLRSTFVRDFWNILDSSAAKTGFIQETSSTLAILRRYLSEINDLLGLIFAFVPQTYNIVSIDGGTNEISGTIVHKKNPFIVKLSLDTSMTTTKVDPRVNVAAATLLAVIDAAKNG